MGPKLRFPEKQLPLVAARYKILPVEHKIINNLKPIIMKRGNMEKDDLRMIAHWKAPRSAGRMENNEENYVREITKLSFSATTERAHIEILTSLDGVQWPTASVILHFFHKDEYPILDFRALWSVSLDVPTQYSFGFWWPYAEYCRDLSKRLNIDMRTLDRALWQYSKENQ